MMERHGIKAILILISVILLLSPLTEAQTQPPSRVELLRKKRLEKAHRLHPYRPGRLERLFMFIEEGHIQAILSRGFAGFYPVFGGIRTGAGTAGGILFRPRLPRRYLHVSLRAAFSIRSYQGYQGVIGFTPRRWSVLGFIRYRQMPKEDFFGIGGNSRAELRSTYRLNDFQVGGAAGVFLGQSVSAMVQLSFLRNDPGPGKERSVPQVGDVFPETEAPGLTEAVGFLISRLQLRFDFRNIRKNRLTPRAFALQDDPLAARTLNPDRGVLLELQLSRYDDVDTDRYSFHRLNVELQEYFSFYRAHQVLAFRQFVSITDRNGHGEIPIYLMQTLGGGNSLRAYRDFRFRDNHVLLLNGEYRWRAWTGLQMALFFDAGKAVSRRSGLNFARMITSYGIGARIRTSRAILLRVGYARGREGGRAFIKFDNIF